MRDARKSDKGAWLWLALAVVQPWGEVAAEPVSSTRERVRGAMEAALDHHPAVVLRVRIEAERAMLEAAALPAGPALEWQTEGLDSGADRQPNAADSLRLRKEVPLFGQRSSSRDYRRQAGEALDSERRVALLELAAETGRNWLELAAVLERRALVAHRLERLDRAVALHHKRLELGEVAGGEVRQLDLQRARESAELASLTLREAELSGLLRRRAGEVPLPLEGDLVVLVSDLLPLPDEAVVLSSGGPLLDAIAARSLAAERRSELVRRTAWGWTEAEVETQKIPSVDGAESFRTFGFRIAVPLPVGKQGRARRGAAEAEVESARAEEQAWNQEHRRRLELALRTAREADDFLAETAGLVVDLPRTEQSLAKQFQLGAISYLIYIDGLSRLDELREDLVETRLSLLAARLELAILLADHQIFPIPSVTKEDPS